MSNYSPSASEFVFIQLEANDGAIPNSTGTATVAASDAIYIESLTISPSQERNTPKYKTGSQSAAVGAIGVYGGTFTLKTPMFGSGAAGTAPDVDVLLACAQGKAGTVVASTSVTYHLEDSRNAYPPTFTMYDFRDPAGFEQVVYRGCYVQSMAIEGATDNPTLTFVCGFLDSLTSHEFSTASSTRKGGLTAFPTRPATPTYIGSAVSGALGSYTFDGTAYTIYSLTITADYARERKEGALFNGGLQGPIMQGIRSVTFSHEMMETDDSTLLATMRKVRSGATSVISCAFGTVAGGIWTPTLSGVQLDPPDRIESENWMRKFTGKASATSATAMDEFVLALT